MGKPRPLAKREAFFPFCEWNNKVSVISALIVAAGKGLRMRSETPKQYLLLAARPILCHTLRAFDRCEAIDSICLVVPESDLAYCRREILPSAGSRRAIRLVAGGCERHDSVYNGLQAVETATDIVVIHDGVRPFVDQLQIEATIEGARRFGACILGILARDTLKHADSSNMVIDTLERESVWLAQTPQALKTLANIRMPPVASTGKPGM